MKCKICVKEFKKLKRQIYCSDKCNDRAYYLRNKKKILKRVRQYQLENPEKQREWCKKSLKKFREEKRDRFNQLMRRVYQRNKTKHYIRTHTNKYRGEILKYFDNKCQQCNSTQNLQIHHKEYMWENTFRYKSLNESVELNKKNLSVFCRECHRNIHNSRKIYKE